MNWTYIISQKSKAALALGIIFILLLGTSLVDYRHRSTLKSSFSSFYKDRLLAESYIYEISGIFHQKQLLLGSSSALSQLGTEMSSLNLSLENVLQAYEETKLTEQEAFYFHNLQSDVEALMIIEGKYEIQPNDQHLHQMKAQYIQIVEKLDKLSEIQLAEGQNILESSNRIFATKYLTSQLEFGVLVVIGLLIQALIFASRSITPKFPQQSSLN